MNKSALRVLLIKTAIKKYFKESDWVNLSILTSSSDVILDHPRLFRSLRFGDKDYDQNILSVIQELGKKDDNNIIILEEYLRQHYEVASLYVSYLPKTAVITFSPNVFNVPTDIKQENDLIAVMMPFNKEFDSVYEGIKNSCIDANYRSKRADDIWDESTFVQDIFNLIFKCKAVVVDFSGKNPNVLYETGIAHTLGKLVIPITQNKADIPSDLIHHRALIYLNNGEGISNLRKELKERLISITH
jgi:hypothetical protein